MMRREQQKKALQGVEMKKETKSVKFNAISQIDEDVILDNEDDSENVSRTYMHTPVNYFTVFTYSVCFLYNP